MREIIHTETQQREELVDITAQAKQCTARAGIRDGLISLYVQGATAAIMIQENWDDSVPRDTVRLLRELIPKGVWEHDAQDGNGDAHLKAGLIGPSETIPLLDGQLGLSTWQGIFLCELDGPRRQREIICTAIPSP